MPTYQLSVVRLNEAANALGDTSGYAIAKRCGLAESTVSRLRRGLARPATSTVMALARAYGVEAAELLKEEAPTYVTSIDGTALPQNDDDAGIALPASSVESVLCPTTAKK